jgi:hypothetical protein
MPLFPVPKFTEMETKIVGPLTFRQFLFALFTVLVCFLLYRLFPRFLSLFLILIVGALGFALTFLKIGNIPFYQVFFEGLTFFFQPKRLSWGKKGGEEPFAFKKWS